MIGAASRVVGALLLLGVVALGQESLRYAPEEGIVLRRKFDGEWPSDHYPVFADIKL